MKDVEYYLDLNWTLAEGEDKGFDGQPYAYITIEEIPSFCFCAPTIERAREKYKEQLRWSLTVMLEMGDEIPTPKQSS